MRDSQSDHHNATNSEGAAMIRKAYGSAQAVTEWVRGLRSEQVSDAVAILALVAITIWGITSTG